MPRKTKEELKIIRDEKRIIEIIEKNKFLRDSKYYKNNYWSWAAWDSWAAKGQAGSCSCGCGYYNATLSNMRKRTQKGGKDDVCRQAGYNLCYECVNKIETKINYKFNRH